MQGINKNIEYFDTLRAIAAIGVIIIHVSTPALNMNYGKNEGFWWIANIVDSAVRFAVPVFLMLTGATLIGKKHNYPEYLKKRFSRVLFPFLFWIVVYYIYRWLSLASWQQPHNTAEVLQWAGKLFITEGVSKHLWYIYMIMAIYFVIPFISNLVLKLNLNTLLIILIVWAVLNFVLRNYAMNLYGWKPEAWSSKLIGWSLHSGYLLAGYYFSRLRAFGNKERIIAAMIFLISIASCAVFTYIFSKQAQKQDLSMYGYLKINTLIQSSAVFLMLKDIRFRNKVILWVQKQISDYSYGIYLVHIIIIGILYNLRFYKIFPNPAVSILIISTITLIMGYLVIYIMRKIPGGKHVSG